MSMKIYRLKNGAMEEAEFYEEGTEEFVKYRDSERLRKHIALAFNRRYNRKVREYLRSLTEEQRTILQLKTEIAQLQNSIKVEQRVNLALQEMAKAHFSEEQIQRTIMLELL